MHNDSFAFIHVRPGTFSKEHPVATIAINTVAEDDYTHATRRYAVGFAAQHVKKDRQWNSEMGRTVSRGRAERSANRMYVHASPNTPRTEFLLLAVSRVLEAVESGEIFATRKVTRALKDTVERLAEAKYAVEHRRTFADLAAE